MRRAYSRATVPSTSQNTEVALAVLLSVRVVNPSRGNGKSRHSQERAIQSQGTGKSWMQKCPWAPHPPHSMSSRLRNTSCPPLGTVFPDRRGGTTKCRTASSGKTARCSKDCSPFVQHIRDWNTETPGLRHQTNPTAAPEGLLPSFFLFSFFFPAHQPPTVGPRICPILYQSSLSHLRLWAERLWTAFCFAGLEHRDNSMWSDEPRGDTREVALQLPAGLVLVATELQSSFVLVFLGSPDPVHPNPQFSLSKKAQRNISWHPEERYRATRTMQPKAKLQEKPLSLAFRKDTGFSGLLKLRHSHSAIKYSPFYAAKQSLQLSPRMAPKGRDTHT